MQHTPTDSGLASLLASRGRNGDSMLVHMGPGEVAGLQQLAMATGGSLSINPHTGLYEASWLSQILPSVASAILNKAFPNLGSFASSALVAAGSGLIQGSFQKGLRSGLQAYGTAKTFEGLDASATASRAAKEAELEKLKKTVGTEALTKERGPMDNFMSQYATAPAPQTVRTPAIQEQIDKLTKELAAPKKTGLGGLWEGIKSVATPAGGEAFMRTLEGNQTNPLLKQASRNAAISGILGIFTPEPEEPKSSKPSYYIPGERNPLYRTGKDQPYYLPGYYSSTPPKYASGGVIPNQNQSYPLANIQHSAYSTSMQDPHQTELFSGYDSAVNPFTGEEAKSQVNFADGGQVDNPFAPKPPAEPAPTPFAVKPPTAGPEGLHIYQAPYKEGWVPPAGIKDYYQALLSPPTGGRDTSALTDWLNNLDKRLKTPTGPTGPTGPTTCPPGQHLNTTTLECEKDEPPPPPPPPPPPGCPTGQAPDANGVCQPIIVDPKCKAGEILNPKTGKCESTAQGCGPGYHVEIVDGVMDCVADNKKCDPGFHNDPSGNCVPDEVKNCDPGYHKDASGNCVPDDKKSACIEVEDPGTGNVITGADCACPDGMSKDPNDNTLCVKGQQKKACDPGFHADASGNCVPDETKGCDEGFHKDASGNCVPDDKKNTCGVEVEDPETGNVIIGGAECACPEGTTRDPKNPTTCIKNKEEKNDNKTCDEGYSKNADGFCVKNPPSDADCASQTANSVYSKVTGMCECAEGYTRTETGACKKGTGEIEECPTGTKMTISDTGEPICVADENAQKDPDFLKTLEKFGGYFLPAKAQLFLKALKSAKVIVGGCRDGEEQKWDMSQMQFVCAPKENKDTGGGSETKEPGENLYNRGGDGYDFGCPDPSMTILLANGGTVTAGDLKVGDVVRTKHEKTSEWGDFEVTHKEIVDQPKAEVILDGGDKKVIVSTSHKFWVDNEKNWVYTTELTHGDVLSGHVLTDVKHLGNGPVVKITVKDAHTYVMEGLWSHNIKIIGGGWPKGSVGIEECEGEGCAEVVNGASGGRIRAKKYATGGIADGIGDYGIGSFRQGGMTQYAAGGKLLHGPGDGMSDDIYANIGGHQEARLADGEFVVPADVVSHIGNGSTNAGAKKLYKMMADIRRSRTGRTKQAPAIKPENYMPRAGR